MHRRSKLSKRFLSKLVPVLRWNARASDFTRCWLPLLPTELRIKLLLTLGSQGECDVESILILAKEFREFGELVLVVLSRDEMQQFNRSDTGIQAVTVEECLNWLPKSKYWDRRPIRLLMRDFRKPHIQHDTSDRIDAGVHYSLPPELISPGTFCQVKVFSEKASCLLLNEANDILPTEIKKMPPVEMMRASMYQWYSAHLGGSASMKTMFMYNCRSSLTARTSAVAFLEVRLLPGRLIKAEPLYRLCPQMVCLKNTHPSQLLHVTFEAMAIPLVYITNHKGSSQADGSTFVLQNANWSPRNPYGTTLSAEIQLPKGMNDEDQATFNEKMALEVPVNIYLPVSYYTNVKLYGVSDSRFYWSSWNNVVSLHWWRLSARAAPDEGDERTPITVMCNSLRVLQIVSVIRRNDIRPLIRAPCLKALSLIALADSNNPWSPGDTLIGDTPFLEHVYLAISTCPTRVMGIEVRHLQKISERVETLHVRGYVPLFVMHGLDRPYHTIRFHRLTTLVLDVSSIARLHHSVAGSWARKSATLSFAEDMFPVLHQVALMCTYEAHMAGICSKIETRLHLGPQIKQIGASLLLRSMEISVNGEPLVIPQDQPYVKPIVQSRRINVWQRDSQSDGFAYLKERLAPEWVFEVSEY